MEKNPELIMVNLEHACWEIDVFDAKDDAGAEAVKGQGYIRLSELRKIVNEYFERESAPCH